MGPRTTELVSGDKGPTDVDPTVASSGKKKRKTEEAPTPAPATKLQKRSGDVSGEVLGVERLQEVDLVRPSPIPPIKFADGFGLWDSMCETDNKYVRSVDPLRNHPILRPAMRSILLEWMMDVCEDLKLHRETLYLAIDYLDRYLSAEFNLQKASLQLIGITSLFIACKINETDPPMARKCAGLSDGAFTVADVVAAELLILTRLEWNLAPMTPCNWVNVYLQILSYTKNRRHIANRIQTTTATRPQVLLNHNIRLSLASAGEPFLWPQYLGMDFVRALRILDLGSLDTKSLTFKYSVLGAAAIYHVKGKDAALESSSYAWEAIAPCVNWLAPFAEITKGQDNPEVLPTIANVPYHARHLIQSHCISLDMLERVRFLQTPTTS